MKVGDEIINVCGKRLRGLSIDEAIQTLKQPIDSTYMLKACQALDPIFYKDTNVSFALDLIFTKDTNVSLASDPIFA